METSMGNSGAPAEALPLERGRPGIRQGKALPQILEACRQRLRGIPRTPAEANYSLQVLSEMREMGWHKSVRSRRPIDAHGDAIPWYTYPALEWLISRVRPTDVVFEFGAGNSTVWFGRHVKRVVSVESNPGWVGMVRCMTGGNVSLISRSASIKGAGSNKSRYVAALEEFEPGTFDIIAIDGEDRVACARVAPARLRSDGIIIWDDSDRPAFRPGIDYLHNQGFGRVDFYGFVSQVGVRKCTSVFFTSGARWTGVNAPLEYQGW
jgi:predicted O-methyltransferase YrrM